jgi:hypothetical protein
MERGGSIFFLLTPLLEQAGVKKSRVNLLVLQEGEVGIIPKLSSLSVKTGKSQGIQVKAGGELISADDPSKDTIYLDRALSWK